MLCQKMEAKGMQEMMMTNPDFMQGMMKQQLGGMLPQVRTLAAPAPPYHPPLFQPPFSFNPSLPCACHHPRRFTIFWPLGPHALRTTPPLNNRVSRLGPLQLALGALVNFFFSGFILGRIPFALSPKFRIMLQRGIDLPSIDPSYFTSLSYYFLLLFGLRGVLTLMFR